MGSDAGTPGGRRPVALVTGVGRSIGIGAASTRIAATLGEAGARAVDVQADLSDPTTPATVYDLVEERLGPVTALVMCHCESVDSGLLDTTVDSFDRHFAVNARATWLLVREHGRRFTAPAGTGRVVALTSDHTVGNLPYGASRGAMDRIVLAAAHELAGLGITANVVNPGPVDTGWMDDEVRQRCGSRPQGAGWARPRTRRSSFASCARRRAAGSTASC